MNPPDTTRGLDLLQTTGPGGCDCGGCGRGNSEASMPETDNIETL